MDAKAKYEEWLNSDLIDDDTKKELRMISGDEKEIEDRFNGNLRFGTGGLRGSMGAGTNRMNRYTVRIATQGLANYLMKVGYIQDGRNCARVAISYDNRYHSQDFALETAEVLVANGIEVHMYTVLHPTPMLSYAVRKLVCDAGVNITASHNPKEDNGYKVYGPDGSQVVFPMDKAIMNEVKEIERLEECQFMSDEEVLVSPLFHVISNEVDDAFTKEVLSLVRRPEDIKHASDLSIVYSPLHGTGLVPVTRVLRELGFKNIYVVDGQAIQIGGFPTVKNPNPENPDAFSLATEQAKKVNAELIIITDPDADRIGMSGIDRESGDYIHFTGNMMGALITEYVLSTRKETGTMPKNPAVVSTVVITDLVREICKEYGVHCEATGLIGFKNIANVIRKYEEVGSYSYVFGLEDSDGCLPGTYVRDKDSIGTAVLLASAAAHYHNQGLTLWDQMKKIYEKYGYYCEILKSKKLEGIEGRKKIADMISVLRENPMTDIAGWKLLSVTDYKLNVKKNLVTGEESCANVEQSNMIYYRVENDGWFLVRPSGTEPTIKFYVGMKGQNIESGKTNAEKLMNALMEVFG